MGVKQVIWVSRTEFCLNDGTVYPINPPLDRDISVIEFQQHYERIGDIIGSLSSFENIAKDTATMGQSRKIKNG